MEADSAVSHHRVDLMEGFTSLLDVHFRDAEFLGKFLAFLRSLRHKLVERRVEETEGDRLAVHYLHCALHRCLDERLEFCEGCTPFIVGLGQNHLAELCKRNFRVLAVEHVLDTEESDAFGSEAEGAFCILRSVGVGPYSESAELVHHLHEADEARVLGGVHSC